MSDSAFQRAWPTLLTLVALLAAWQLAGLTLRESYLPPLSAILPQFFTLLEGEIWPHIAASLLRLAAGFALALVIGVIVMVSSEMIVRQNGIGNYLFNALDMAQYELTYAVILIVAIIGFALDWLFETIRRRLTFWAPAPRDELVVP